MNRSLDGYDIYNKSLTGLLDQGTTTLYQTVAGMSNYLTTSTASSLYQTISGMTSYLTAIGNNVFTGNNIFSGINGFYSKLFINGLDTTTSILGFNNCSVVSISANIVNT